MHAVDVIVTLAVSCKVCVGEREMHAVEVIVTLAVSCKMCVCERERDACSGCDSHSSCLM